MHSAILTTDTDHHRYLVNRLAQRATVDVVLESRRLNYKRRYLRHVFENGPTALWNNPYLQPPKPLFKRRRDRFEERFFEDGLPREWQADEITRFHDVNDPESMSLLSSWDPDLLVSFGTLLIKDGILGLDVPKVNVHRGILPDYRGLDSSYWAFYHEDFENVGTTIHEIDPSFDTGPIVHQEKLDIQPGMRAHQIRYHTTIQAADMIERILDDLEAGKTVEGVPQNPDDGRYYSHIPPLKRWLAVRRFHSHVRSLPEEP